MLQLVDLLTMEPPNALGADRVRDEKVKVLDSIVPSRRDADGTLELRPVTTAAV